MIQLFDIDAFTWAPTCATGCSQQGPKLPNFFRTVSFSNQVRVSEIPNKESLSKRQKQVLWHTEPHRRGYGHFKHLQRILCGSSPEHNFDGDGINPELQERGPNSILPVSAVLSEQENQRHEGYAANPAAIAKIYRQCSAYSSVRAQMRALEFELDAQEYLSEPSRHGRKMIMLLDQSTS